MPEAFGILQGYWVSSGLALDILGFLCLYFEWARDRSKTNDDFQFDEKRYDSYKKQLANLEEAIKNQKEKANQSTNQYTNFKGIEKFAASKPNFNKRQYDAQKEMNRRQAELDENNLQSLNDQMNSFKANEMGELIKLRELRYRADPFTHEVARSRWFKFGTMLIVFGFILQIIGSWPLSA